MLILHSNSTYSFENLASWSAFCSASRWSCHLLLSENLATSSGLNSFSVLSSLFLLCLLFLSSLPISICITVIWFKKTYIAPSPLLNCVKLLLYPLYSLFLSWFVFLHCVNFLRLNSEFGGFTPSCWCLWYDVRLQFCSQTCHEYVSELCSPIPASQSLIPIHLLHESCLTRVVIRQNSLEVGPYFYYFK